MTLIQIFANFFVLTFFFFIYKLIGLLQYT